MSKTDFELVIKPSRGWRPIDFREIWFYRELFFYLAWRDVAIRYRQTALGALWAVLQVLLPMAIFAYLFGRLAGMSNTLGDGAPPYALFSLVGLVAWTFFANSVTSSSNSLVGNQHLVSKIYFPRVFVPLASIGALLVDLAIAVLVCFGALAFFRRPPTPALLTLPVFILGAALAAGGIGLLLSALNVQFRDIKYVVPFAVQMGLFLTPVIYPVSSVPEAIRPWLGLNPMAGITEGFRFAILGSPANWGLVAVSSAVSVVLFIGGLLVFHRMERRFADLI
jgi:lipopolysaccharide transport system permease protein